MSDNHKGIAYALVTLTFWGFLPIFLKVAVSEVSPQTIVWFRFCSAFIMLLIWNIIQHPKELQVFIKPPLALLIASACLAWNYFGFMQAVNYTSPSNAQLVMQVGPVLLALAGVVLFKEQLKKIQMSGFIVAMIGFVLFYQQQVSLASINKENYNIGVLFAVSGLTTWAIYAVLQKKLVLRYNTRALNTFIFAFATIVYLPFVEFSDFIGLTFGDWLLLLFLGLNTLVAYGCLSQALKYTQANKVSVILLLNPIITFAAMSILSFLDVKWIAKEEFTPLSILSAILVLTGAILVIRKPKMDNQLQN
ncbi:MAG: DMT family transporter [Mangrovibacterium sp.]